MSVMGNILFTKIPPEHAPPEWGPSPFAMAGAAVWPIALAFAVEVLAQTKWKTGKNFWYWYAVRILGAGTVALGAFIISYIHIPEVLIQWKYGDVGALFGPLVLDGLMVISGFALLSMRQAQHPDLQEDTVPAAEQVEQPPPPRDTREDSGIASASRAEEPLPAPPEPTPPPIPIRRSPISDEMLAAATAVYLANANVGRGTLAKALEEQNFDCPPSTARAILDRLRKNPPTSATAATNGHAHE